jgi:hypothetical protein
LAPSGRVFMKFDTSVFFFFFFYKIQVLLKLSGITATVRGDVSAFLIMSLSFLRMRNISDKLQRKSKHAFYVR